MGPLQFLYIVTASCCLKGLQGPESERRTLETTWIGGLIFNSDSCLFSHEYIHTDIHTPEDPWELLITPRKTGIPCFQTDPILWKWRGVYTLGL